MKITYISHSGFAVELENHIFLFDYYKGEIPKFDPKKSIVVFASHVHHDHYVEEIFELREQYPDVRLCSVFGYSKVSEKNFGRKANRSSGLFFENPSGA